MSFYLVCRDEATRTPDPHVPNVVRYQLRYIPIISIFWRGKDTVFTFSLTVLDVFYYAASNAKNNPKYQTITSYLCFIHIYIT